MQDGLDNLAGHKQELLRIATDAEDEDPTELQKPCWRKHLEKYQVYLQHWKEGPMSQFQKTMLIINA